MSTGPDFPYDNTKMQDIMDVLDGPEQVAIPIEDDHPVYCKCEYCRPNMLRTNPAHGGKIWEA